ncbi:MAG: hypothetical protein DRH08_14360, partial [Deltaproteobacteria bacterium]
RFDEGDREDAREDRQEAREERQDDRQDFIDDQHDDYWDDHHDYWDDDYGGFYAGVAVGAAVTTTYITTLPCTTTAVVVNGVSYYQCTNAWYQRGYSGSQVNYITVNAPPGY